MPELPIDPSEILRALERVRTMIGSSPLLADLPGAFGRADDVLAAINRLTDELARLNENIEQTRPTVEALERHIARSASAFETVQGLQGMLRWATGSRPAAGGPPPAADEPEAPPEPPEPLR